MIAELYRHDTDAHRFALIEALLETVGLCSTALLIDVFEQPQSTVAYFVRKYKVLNDTCYYDGKRKALVRYPHYRRLVLAPGAMPHVYISAYADLYGIEIDHREVPDEDDSDEVP